MAATTQLLKVYDNVWVDAVDGFGGPAHIVEVREADQSQYKVRMNDGTQPDFWAHDGEVTRMVREERA